MPRDVLVTVTLLAWKVIFKVNYLLPFHKFNMDTIRIRIYQYLIHACSRGTLRVVHIAFFNVMANSRTLML